jgi:hypothetical protein
MILKQRLSRKRPSLAIVMMFVLLAGALGSSPAGAQGLPFEPGQATITLEITNVTCDGLIEYTYTSDNATQVGFQFYMDRPGNTPLNGGAGGPFEVPAGTRSGSVQGTFFEQPSGKNDRVEAYHALPGDSFEVLDEAPIEGCGDDTADIIQQLIAVLIALLRTLLNR